MNKTILLALSNSFYEDAKHKIKEIKIILENTKDTNYHTPAIQKRINNLLWLSQALRTAYLQGDRDEQ